MTWTRIALIVSLAVNLLIVGIVAGDQFRDRGAPRIPVTPDLRATIAALPPAMQDDLRAALREAVPDRREMGRVRRQEARDFARLMQADEVDRAALETLLARRSAGMDAMRARVQERLVDALVSLDREERLALLDRLARMRGPRDGQEGG
ncbi:periplasmic heavy metal sensor [Roseobacter sp. HKCCA0434]|uniref:periplasmic heavy metal sensor n=1 Tax=Roseobacter sp. HKCCA0434 TaxID=3079297 RepID=UPI002905C4E8|nr:periplasmic heavy metal sensor [Roseobacter sp. HKCCA0434]